MPLPDATRLLAAPPGLWGAFAARLRALELTSDRVRRISSVGRTLPTGLARPLRRWHLRRERGAAAYAMRAFLFGDPVSPQEAGEALGEISLDRLLESGLLTRDADGTIVSPFLTNLVNDLYIVCDDLSHGGAAVMGAGETTADLCRAAYPVERIDSALDLGCGAGTGALLLAPRVRRVVGTDANPRAIVLSRLNAAINGVDHVEFREGDLFQPVLGETFDLIFSQPPFVAGPDAAGAATYLHGGARGDEIAFRVLAGIGPQLGPGGRAVLLTEWPDLGDGPIEQRVRQELRAPELSVLILEGRTIDLDEHCAWYALGENPDDLAAFGRRAELRREHLERMGIRALRLAVNVVHRGPSTPGWTSKVSVRPLTEVPVTSSRIGLLLAARHLVAAGHEALLDADLGTPDGTVFCEERDSPDPGGPVAIRARFPDEVLVPPLLMNREAFELVALVHEVPSVRAAVERLAASCGATKEDSAAKVLPAVERALLYGLLEVR